MKQLVSDNRITESFRPEKTFEIIKSNCAGMATQPLPLCLITLLVQILFIIPNLNLLIHNLRPFPLILSLWDDPKCHFSSCSQRKMHLSCSLNSSPACMPFISQLLSTFPPVSSQFIVLFILFTYSAIYFSFCPLLCSCPCPSSTRMSSV